MFPFPIHRVGKMRFEKATEGQGGGSVGEVLAAQIWGPEFEPSEPLQNWTWWPAPIPVAPYACRDMGDRGRKITESCCTRCLGYVVATLKRDTFSSKVQKASTANPRLSSDFRVYAISALRSFCSLFFGQTWFPHILIYASQTFLPQIPPLPLTSTMCVLCQPEGLYCCKWVLCHLGNSIPRSRESSLLLLEPRTRRKENYTLVNLT